MSWQWAVILPVKTLDVAKSRLMVSGTGDRSALMLAFASDVLTVALATPSVAAVIVVTDDPRVEHRVRGLGALVTGDAPGSGLNPSLARAAGLMSARYPTLGVVALAGDLPAARPGQLGRTLQEAAPLARSFLADAAGIGTTLLAAAPGVPLAPAFGVRSRAAHSRGGAVELLPHDVAGLRRDVDTDVDLWDAIRLGVGPHTLAALERNTASQRTK